MPSVHALLSASSAHRWLHCTPSALFQAKAPQKTTVSSAAEEGTAAHALAEWKLLGALGLTQGERPESEYEDAEMDEATDDYVSFIMSKRTRAKATCADACTLVEEHLDFSDWVPEGFGTGDALIIAEPTLHIIDLKYGQGLVVSAHDNPQMRLYALGAYATFGALYDIREVSMSIFQPRRQNYDTEVIAVEELLAWADEVVKPAAELAQYGQGDFKAGTWCQFCALRATCRARAEENLVLVQSSFKATDELTDDEVSEVLLRAAEVKSWLSDVEAYALAKAINKGHTWPHMKLVEGRTRRCYSDEAAVKEALSQAGVQGFMKESLLGISDMERFLGKKRFSELLGSLVYKPQGKPSLVSEDDKREALVIDIAHEFLDKPLERN